jgi:Bacterial RNA polymerase, alpha chain C terminal domain/Homeodomain-like domain
MTGTADSTDSDPALPIERMGLGTRTSWALQYDGLKTAGELAALTDAELLRIPNVGKVALAEVRGALAALGIERTGSPRAHYALDVVDGTTRVSVTMPELVSCVVAAVEQLCREKLTRELLAASVGSREERDRAIWAAWRSGGVTQPEIARRFGISTPQVNIVIRRFWTAEVLPTLTAEQQQRVATWGHNHKLGMSWYNGT